MRVLYDMIHARAGKNWHEPVTRENYERWADHWLNCTRALQSEFEADGLPETASALGKIWDEQAKLNGVTSSILRDERQVEP